MLEVEVQKLTAAIEALTKALLNPPKFAVALEAVENTQQGDETLSQLDKEIINRDRINREDDAAREAMQAQRDRKQAEDAAIKQADDDAMAKIRKRHDATMVAVYGETEVEKRKQAEDAAMAAIYKREAEKKQTVKARKAHAVVTTEETKALVEASTMGPIEQINTGGLRPTDNSANSPEAEKIAANISANIPEGRPDITETSLKTMALEIVRVDSSAREKVLALLAEYNAKTFVQLSPKHHHEVHAKLSTIAAEVGSA